MQFSKDFQSLKFKIQSETDNIAKDTLLLEPQIVAMNERLSSLTQKYDSMRVEYDKSFSIYENIFEKYNLDSILKQFQSLMEQDEQISDDILQQFLRLQTLDIEVFIEQYFHVRQSYHQRSMKYNKLKELIKPTS